MVRVGLAGLGFMGGTHAQCHAAIPNAKLAAVCDVEEDRRTRFAETYGATPYASLDEMLKADIDMVDLCLPTYLHKQAVEAAAKAKKHVLCEKPMALTPADCDAMIAAVKRAGVEFMVGHVIRFWPEYEVLADFVQSGKLGRLVSLKLTRLSPSPFWSEGGWLNDPGRSGGALLDLHIHDADFIMSALGMPPAVFSRAGHIAEDGPKVDQVITHYLYDDAVVVAEGGWSMPPTYQFEMAYEALGENGCLKFSTSMEPMLTFMPMQGEPSTPTCRATTGYHQELEYFAQCIAENTSPERVTPFDAREAVRLVMAEKRSIETGQAVSL